MSQSTITQDSIRLDSWRSVFEKIDRILSEQKVRVSIVNDPSELGMADVPAWSDGMDIFLSGPKIKEMLAANDKLAAVLRLKGLNYHELCHVLFTPRMSDELPRRLREKVTQTGENKWWYAFNALEDQRIETWFTTMYGASRRYFEATILEWIIKNGSPEAAVLIYGRKYLTPRIRVQAGTVFQKRYGKPLYDEFQTVIDDYLRLVLPTDSIKAMNLLTRYVELLDKMRSMSGSPLPMLVINDNGGDTCPSRNQDGVARSGRVYIRPIRDAQQRVEEAIEDAIDADLDEASKSDPGKPGKSGSPKPAQGGSPQPGDSQSQTGSGDKSDQSASGDPQDNGDAQGASSSGTANHTDPASSKKGVQAETADAMKDLVEEAHDGLDAVQDDEWVQQDIDNMLNAVRAAENNGKMNAQGKAVGAASFSPTEGARMAVRKVHDILARIRQEAEPETLWGQVHGRVDGRRLVQRRPHEVNIFKTWDHGNEEETGVESVILVDVSGSMQNRLADASVAMWALKRAFDKLDIRTTVLMFDTDHTVVYQPGERAHANGVPQLKPGGGTNPGSALEQAELILRKSQAPNKVLITLTDGQWAGEDKDYVKRVKRMHGFGVTTMLLGLDHAVQKYGKHGHLEGHDLRTVRELPKVALKLVSRIMRDAAA